MTTLSNENLRLTVEDHGAELSSIRRGDREYLWNADPAFWKRHSPVLFPIVGSVWGGEYRSHSKTFALGQHGFARDMDFKLLSCSADEVWYVLSADDETLKKYPYEFILRIGYRLRGNEIDVLWEVENPTSEDIWFQIGAHPAFYYKPGDYFRLSSGEKSCVAGDKACGSSDRSACVETCVSRVITEGGCVHPTLTKSVSTEDGYLLLDAHTFDDDALVLEDSQLSEVSICSSDRKPYLTVRFSSPLVGLWSPPHKNAPFVCIEPWYGRCDTVGFAGEYEQKDHMNRLGANEVFKASYTIVIE